MLFRTFDNKIAVSDTLNNLGAACFGENDLVRARQHFAQAANLAFDLGNKITISYSLDGFAALAVENNDLERAAKLCGAAEALRQLIGYEIEPAEERFRNAYREKLRARMDESLFDAAFEQGREMSPEDAVKQASDANISSVPEH